jgi:hypothetical protein
MSSLLLSHSGLPEVLPDAVIHNLTTLPDGCCVLNCEEIHARVMFAVDEESVRRVSPKLADEIQDSKDGVSIAFTKAYLEDDDEFDALITLLYFAHGLTNFVRREIHRPVQQLAGLARTFINYNAWSHTKDYLSDWLECFEDFPRSTDLDMQFYVYWAVGHIRAAEATMRKLMLSLTMDRNHRLLMLNEDASSYPSLEVSKLPKLQFRYMSGSLKE